MPNDAISLDFYSGFSTGSLINATLKLNISTDGGANWTKIWEANNDGTAWQWREISLDLSNYNNNSNIMLGWQYVGNYGDLVGIEEDAEVIPTEFALKQNYPNPFNTSTTIEYSIPRTNVETRHTLSVQLRIYNILGQKVAEIVNKVQNAGNYKAHFNATNFHRVLTFIR